MRVSIVLCFLILSLAVAVLAQNERYVKPVDEAKKDASFFAFREKLIAAAKKRDARYVLSVVDKNIKNGFGGNDGIAEFKKFWKLESASSRFWEEFLPVITGGGTFSGAGRGKLFFAPYSFSAFPDDLDAFTHSVIFGRNVNLRPAPETEAPVVAKLSYNIVEVLNAVKNKNDAEKDDWYEVRTFGGKKGFVKAEFVRSPIDYRAGFEKKNGVWKMTFFVAGD